MLATIFALSGTNDDAIREGLTVILQHAWALPTALSLITWYVFAPQCISTLAVARRGTNSWKWPTVMFIYQMLLAYLMSWVVFNIAQNFIR